MKRIAAWAPIAASFLAFIAGCKSQPAPTPSVLIPFATSRPAIDSMAPATAPSSVALPPYLKPDAFDYRSLLGGPPRDNLAVHQDEIALLLHLQEIRTVADEQRCREEVAVTAFGFANVIGPWFTEHNLPLTAKLMKESGQQVKAATGGAKRFWARVRPPVADSRIHPCVPLEPTFSYPSGHATIGAFWGSILAEMFPADADILRARGKQIGFDRLIAGMHWPSDVAAGENLGQEIARRMLADPQFRARLDKAKAECHAAMKH